jgi:hypothetical protein
MYELNMIESTYMELTCKKYIQKAEVDISVVGI